MVKKLSILALCMLATSCVVNKEINYTYNLEHSNKNTITETGDDSVAGSEATDSLRDIVASPTLDVAP